MFNSHGGTHNSALEPCALGAFKGNDTVCLGDDAHTGTELERILACSRDRTTVCEPMTSVHVVLVCEQYTPKIIMQLQSSVERTHSTRLLAKRKECEKLMYLPDAVSIAWSTTPVCIKSPVQRWTNALMPGEAMKKQVVRIVRPCFQLAPLYSNQVRDKEKMLDDHADSSQKAGDVANAEQGRYICILGGQLPSQSQPELAQESKRLRTVQVEQNFE
jgi:hypothetical protein